MPELPEVECTRKTLMGLENLKIKSVYLSQVAPIKHAQKSDILKKSKGAQISSIYRKAKYLFFVLDEKHELIIHLGMSGKLLIEKNEARHKHCHLELLLNDQSKLRFIDPRRFGIISFIEFQKWPDHPYAKNMGPDYLERSLSDKKFIERCRRHPKINLKSLCLNQSVAAGLGNIYACESLYDAKLNPQRLIQNCSDEDLKRLYQSAKKILRLGIKKGGSTLRDYVNGQGHRGKMKDFLKVYDREDQESLDKKGKVLRFTQQGRSTFWVPEVQN